MTSNRAGKTRKRLAICCWNAMALSSSNFVELLQWASVRQIDALMIQSTHWSIVEPWTSHGYHIIPSPELHKAGGGLITAIRTSICSMRNISFQDWLPGRLLHVRCYLNKHRVDLVNIYQVPTGQTLTRPEPLKHRLEIWNSVHQLLHQLPVRNTLVLGGDFNTSLRVGTGAAASDWKYSGRLESLDPLQKSVRPCAASQSHQGLDSSCASTSGRMVQIFAGGCHFDSPINHSGSGTPDLTTASIEHYGHNEGGPLHAPVAPTTEPLAGCQEMEASL